MAPPSVHDSDVVSEPRRARRRSEVHFINHSLPAAQNQRRETRETPPETQGGEGREEADHACAEAEPGDVGSSAAGAGAWTGEKSGPEEEWKAVDAGYHRAGAG